MRKDAAGVRTGYLANVTLELQRYINLLGCILTIQKGTFPMFDVHFFGGGGGCVCDKTRKIYPTSVQRNFSVMD
jgi:hypothetical protein